MNFSKEMIEKAKTAKTAEELLEMAKREGVELSAEDAETYFSFLTEGRQPLSDEELSQVAGGKNDDPNYRYCKYCANMRWMTYYWNDYGWDKNDNRHDCMLYRCDSCYNINYYDVKTGEVI